MASIPKKPKSPTARGPAQAKRRLSPRGRGSVVSAVDEDRLLRLVADNLRRLRVSAGLSQEKLADACDLDRTYVSGIERGLRNVSIRNVQRLADALQVDPRMLLDPDLVKDRRFAATKLATGADRAGAQDRK